MTDTLIEHVTCLGCGCACDDIALAVAGGRITGVRGACPAGERWLGNGTLPAATLVNGGAAAPDAALDAAARLLFAPGARVLVYLAGDLTCDAHREAVALADRIRAAVDGPASDTVAAGILAAQRRGRPGATLGELRHRADLVVCWGTDPDQRYPRFTERFLPPTGMHVTGRTVVAVDVGHDRAPAGAAMRLSLRADEEVDALNALRARVRGQAPPSLPASLAAVARLAEPLASARYAAFVYDAEPSDPARDPARVEALIALVQALNGPTRAVLYGLRAGGNRSGIEALLTWQTGYPFAVDFAAGYPRYEPEEGAAARIAGGRHDAVLLLGAPGTVPPAVAAALARVPVVAVGPRASEAPFPTRVAIDTGAGALHEGGLVLRMDDVPIHTRPVLAHARTATAVVQALRARAPARTPEVTP